MALAAVLASSNARGAGPLSIYDAATRTPYAWPKGDVPVYVDDSGFGPLTKAQADSMVAYAISQWNSVAKAKHRRGMGRRRPEGAPRPRRYHRYLRKRALAPPTVSAGRGGAPFPHWDGAPFFFPASGLRTSRRSS